MGKKPDHTVEEKIAMGFVIAAATDNVLVGSVAIFNRGLEITKLDMKLWDARVDRTALAQYLDESDDEPWLPRAERTQFRDAMTRLLECTRPLNGLEMLAAGARDPEVLAGQLNLLLEGAIVDAYVSGNKDAASLAKTMAAVFVEQAFE